MCPGAPNGPHNRHVSSVVAEAMPGDWVTLGGPGTPVAMIHGIQCGLIYTCRLVKGSSYLEYAFKQTASIQCTEIFTAPFSGRGKKALKQTQCSQLIAWSSPLSSFSSTNQTVNGVCSFQTACDFFFSCDCGFRVITGPLVYEMGQNQKTISSHLDPSAFP